MLMDTSLAVLWAVAGGELFTRGAQTVDLVFLKLPPS
jgi:hypothetical protein